MYVRALGVRNSVLKYYSDLGCGTKYILGYMMAKIRNSESNGASKNRIFQIVSKVFEKILDANIH